MPPAADIAQEPEFSELVLLLLKGAIHRAASERLWAVLVRVQARVGKYVAVLGLQLVLDETEGYALLRPRTGLAALDPDLLPQFAQPRALSFSAALLLALLRRTLANFDVRGGASRLVLRRDDVVGLLRPFLADGAGDSHCVAEAEATIDALVEMGYLRRLASPSGPVRYEVPRMLKALVDAPWLQELERCLSAPLERSAVAPTGEADPR